MTEVGIVPSQLRALQVKWENDSTGDEGCQENVDDDVLLEPEVLHCIRPHQANQLLLPHGHDLGGPSLRPGLAGLAHRVQILLARLQGFHHNLIVLHHHRHLLRLLLSTLGVRQGGPVLACLFTALISSLSPVLPLKENVAPVSNHGVHTVLGCVGELLDDILANDEEQDKEEGTPQLETLSYNFTHTTPQLDPLYYN